jgi:hypothetical protein
MKKLSISIIFILTTSFFSPLYAQNCGNACQGGYENAYADAVNDYRSDLWDILYENSALLYGIWQTAETSTANPLAGAVEVGAAFVDLFQDALPSVWEDCSAADQQFYNTCSAAADNLADCMSNC